MVTSFKAFRTDLPGFSTRFFLSIHPLHLPYMIPCSYRASACKAVLPSCMAFYVISVRQTEICPWLVCSHIRLPSDSTSRWTPLTFGYILPTTGRIRDLHPLETCAAGLLQKGPDTRQVLLLFQLLHCLVLFSTNGTAAILFHCNF